ncbi:MAG: L-rhamnose mutarotase [Chloroflexi bacterium]|nr:MAG: L-rhamnose mutarotase [Chloroflexota bacterium]
MQRIAFLMRIQPGTEEEYQRRHTAVWPEMLSELTAAGCRSYSIFQSGLQLFAYLEVEDADHYQDYLAESPVAARWEAFMSDILVREVDPVTNFPPLLPEVFHLGDGFPPGKDSLS